MDKGFLWLCSPLKKSSANRHFQIIPFLAYNLHPRKIWNFLPEDKIRPNPFSRTIPTFSENEIFEEPLRNNWVPFFGHVLLYPQFLLAKDVELFLWTLDSICWLQNGLQFPMSENEIYERGFCATMSSSVLSLSKELTRYNFIYSFTRWNIGQEKLKKCYASRWTICSWTMRTCTSYTSQLHLRCIHLLAKWYYTTVSSPAPGSWRLLWVGGFPSCPP